MKNKGSFERLMQLYDTYMQDPQHTSASFERDFGLGNAYLRTAERSGIPFQQKRLHPKTVQKIHQAQPKLNIEWLANGIGQPWMQGEEQSAPMCVGRPYFNIDFLSGFDIMSCKQVPRQQEYMSVPPFDSEDIYWCNLTGESMFPKIISGARICLRHIAGGVDEIVYGKIYAIVTRNSLRAVRWIARADDEEKIRLIPENKDPKYGDYQDIYKSEVVQIFKVELALNPL